MESARRHERHAAAAAVLVTTAGVLPVFLLGALSVQLRADLHFSKTMLGGLLALFFGVAALTSMLGGRVAERLGPARSMRLACAGSGVCSLGVAAGARGVPSLAVALALGGASNALGQPSTNLLLARAVPVARRGFAFGLKQSAIPLATLLGGLAVPGLALTVGWRWAYVAGAVAAGATLFAIPRVDVPADREGEGSHVQALATLALLGIGGGLGAAAAGALGGFFVDSGVASGLSESTAGMVLSAGSAVNFVTRLTSGARADRRGGGHFRWVAIMLVAGASGYLLLAWGNAALFTLGAMLAFGAGWGWPSVFHLAVVVSNPGAPGAATGVTQTGVYVGGCAGPLVFGALAEHQSYAVAWSSAGAAVVGASALVLLGRARVRGARQARAGSAGVA